MSSKDAENRVCEVPLREEEGCRQVGGHHRRLPQMSGQVYLLESGPLQSPHLKTATF